MQPNNPTNSQTRIYDGAMDAATDSRSGLLNFAKISMSERASLHRDLENASLLTLGGVITIATIGSHLIKTPVLFILSGASLIIGATCSYLSRLAILNYLQNLVGVLETRYANIMMTARTARSNSNDPSAQTRFTDVLNQQNELPKLSKFGDLGHLIAVALLFMGVILLILSLAFHVGI